MPGLGKNTFVSAQRVGSLFPPLKIRLGRRTFWKSELVENEGSIARDILATERTFLAWARTGLGFVGAGSALAAAYHREEQRLAPAIMPASTLLIGNGAFLLLFATRRYYTVLAALRNNQFLINTNDTLMAVAFTAINSVASLAIVWNAELSRSSERESEETKPSHGPSLSKSNSKDT